MLESTMQDSQLTISSMLEHSRRVYATSRVLTFEGDGVREASYGEVGARAHRLASALQELGVGRGDRVGTFLWNTQEHLEAYLAVPSMGAVLHTLNLRLFPEQLAYVINHAADKVVIVDSTILPLLLRVADQLTTVEQYLLVGEADASALGKPVHAYEKLLADAAATFVWPELDERTAAAMCYTSGTTGNPKGVVYSHRSTYLHSLASGGGNTFNLSENDTVLPVVPMFHANAWGLPYSGWLAGADFVMPGRFLQAEPLAKMIETYKPTIAGAVPTIWNDLLTWIDEHPTDMSSLRVVPCGGSAVPQSLMKAYQERHGVRIIQAWGMTETSPLAAVSHPPKGYEDDEWPWRSKTGRILAGVEMRLVGESGDVLPWDGTAVGEVQVRGPWVTGSYHLDPDPAKFDGGWLRTGDVASVSPEGFIQITDRAKDVIKSGGEWISSVDLENALMGHPSVREAAVVAVPDERWVERPLACVVLRDGASASPKELSDYLEDKVAKWWLPERWSFIAEVPRTSVGKFDKKVLRAQYADHELTVEQLTP
ncbi:MAG: long-chain fatty acid--CoA ligase [Frankiales bacterium]|nr:long-chain fatty acid--CoA ligase [Frankiales bacterium]